MVKTVTKIRLSWIAVCCAGWLYFKTSPYTLASAILIPLIIMEIILAWFREDRKAEEALREIERPIDSPKPPQ
jgi:hypothetical protein